ncbi:hypothetical protein [Planctomicrobium piriforme]|uniref:DUF1795 domain-containing protein n=1 Tax=Planctomicrobium piriforme TaxID=1576369 RepID=A0A1I3T587_9PLAN|nr:hypothetical protein [Planctomicrobium piriforme]SFJ64991.1 hypothetical protein SAMN05421753_12715 [Planctomicrobium piriforme]
MFSIRIFLLTALFAGFINECPGQDSYLVMPVTGYQIKVLDPGSGQAGGFDAVRFYLPGKDQFAANIGVQHHPFSGSLDDYLNLSKDQFKNLNLKVIQLKNQDGVIIGEATGKIGGLPASEELHFYFRAIKIDQCVVLATATCLEKSWEQDKLKLVPVIDSLSPTK